MSDPKRTAADLYLLPLSILGVLVLITWGGVLGGSFQFDDYANVVTDKATTDLGVWWERLGTGIRPLTRTSYFIDHGLWGMRAGGFLLTNLLLHLATVAGVFWLARRRTGVTAAGFAGAAVFALQPANAETIAYVSGRSTGLMACLLVLSLVAHEHFRPRLSWIAVGLFVAACLAKEVALVFPALVWLWETTRPSQVHAPQPPPTSRAVLPYAVAGLGGATIVIASPRFRELLHYSLEVRSPFENLLLQARAVPEMLSFWFRPHALTVDHAFAPTGHRLATLAGAALLAGLIGVAIGTRRRYPALTFAIGWALLALLPTQSVIAKLDIVSEKPLYLAWLGPSILVAVLTAHLVATDRSRGWQGWRREFVAASLAAGLTVSAAACVWRVRLWSDDLSLWQDALAKNPRSSRAWNNAGLALAADDPDRAAAAFRRAVEIDPTNHRAMDNLLLYTSVEER